MWEMGSYILFTMICKQRYYLPEVFFISPARSNNDVDLTYCFPRLA